MFFLKHGVHKYSSSECALLKSFQVMGSKVKVGQQVDGRGNYVNSTAPEPLNGLEPKFTQVLTTLGRRND